MPDLYIIAGPNGAGKTTASFTILPEGYNNINLIFLWLNTPELAKERVQTRVAKGGHNIPEDVIRRRYKKGLQNFVNLFMALCDQWMVADNSQSTPVLIAKGKSTHIEFIFQKDIWNKILSYGSK